MEFVSKEAQNSASLPPFWTVLRSQSAFSWRHSDQEILSEWLPTSLLTASLGYGCSWAVLFRGKFAPNAENDGIEDIEVNNPFEKIHFADLLKEAKLVAGFCSFPPISSWTEWRHINTTWLPSTVPKRRPRPPKSHLSKRISSGWQTLQRKNLVEWKSWTLTWNRAW